MFEKIKYFFLCCLIAACGAYEGEERQGITTLDGEEELGQVEQEFKAKNSATYQLGVTTSSARLACGKTSSAQVCTIPSKKIAKYLLASGTTAADKTIYRNVFSTINTAVGTSVWTETTDPTLSDLQVDNGTCSGAASSSNIESFGCLTFNQEADLTEGVQEDDPVGQYKVHTRNIAAADFGTVDKADCTTKFSGNPTAIVQCQRHALGHVALAWNGIGSRSDSTGGVQSTFARRTLAVAGTVLAGPNVGDSCRLSSLDTTANGDFSIFHNSACND